ncbi:ubiquinol oxidase subunit II [Paenirhodobacter populi]|uniref:ubiquinol oxidase subunit II n=1 Tax=Paenirhodobacter populi TaxID=2306993 RepID=UPI001F4E46EF|nr:ubiquinol oxidase subunit II [Sinirhodobacter populi]
MKLPKFLLMLPVAVLLAGCQYDVLVPTGWVGAQQRDLLLISVLLMLIVIIPVMVMVVYFPWKYRATRKDNSDYEPDFSHSTKIEVFVWGVPILIILALGTYTYIYTHRLDPYRPLDHVSFNEEPLQIEAVSLDWKWLFIYPQYGVATVNEIKMPVGRQVEFRLTSSTVMNTFVVPKLGGMIYSMTGMQTKLHLVADEPGVFAGRSAHYSGPGFSGMSFNATALGTPGDEAGNDALFNDWIEEVRAQGTDLTDEAFLQLEKPSMADPARPSVPMPVTYYRTVSDNLFDRIAGMCVEPGKVCMSEMMMQDRAGGGGEAGLGDKHRYEYDSERAVDGFGNAMPPQAAPFAPARHGAAGHDHVSAVETEGHTNGQ